MLFDLGALLVLLSVLLAFLLVGAILSERAPPP